MHVSYMDIYGHVLKTVYDLMKYIKHIHETSMRQRLMHDSYTITMCLPIWNTHIFNIYVVIYAAHICSIYDIYIGIYHIYGEYMTANIVFHVGTIYFLNMVYIYTMSSVKYVAYT